MITKDHMMPLLLAACPSFARAWAELQSEDEAELTYVCISRFIRHLRELHRAGDPSAFAAVAEVIERFHVEGDPYVSEAATVGFLEDLLGDPGAEFFVSFLGPESCKWLAEVRAFWRGERHYIGEGLQRQLTEEDLRKIREELRVFNEKLRREREGQAS